MNPFVESLKRLYNNRFITKNKINELYKENKITYDEKEYILSN